MPVKHLLSAMIIAIWTIFQHQMLILKRTKEIAIKRLML